MNNVLIFHLESVNNFLFDTHREWFKNLNMFLNESTYFKNYYSTATSTYMVISDLFYGDMTPFEESKSLDDMLTLQGKNDTFIEKLRSSGYNIGCYCYGFQDQEEAYKYLGKYFYDNEMYVTVLDKDKILQKMTDQINNNSGFVIYFNDSEGHWSGIDIIGDGDTSSVELYKKKYCMMDDTFGDVLQTLKQSGRYEETLIIVYGDHGDDIYSHGLHDGYTHAIEPYSFMVNCPLLIKNYNGLCIPETALLSTVDIYDMVLLNNVSLRTKKEVVYSRNLFKGQKTCRASFNKSYMVSNGIYTILVSNKGLKMYNNEIDVLNGRNLLDFFYINSSGDIIYNTSFDYMLGSHYKKFMTSYTVENIRDNYKVLYCSLSEYIIFLYGNSSDMNMHAIDYSDDVKNNRLKIRLLFRKSLHNSKNLIKMVLPEYCYGIIRKGILKYLSW